MVDRNEGGHGSAGQTLPLFAISLVAILAFMGLGLDAAQTFLERRDAQGAADLAALAGARELPGDSVAAKAKAFAVAQLNGYPNAAVTVTTPYKSDPSKIHVEIDSNADLFFMPVLGLTDLDVGASAAAIAAGAAASCTFCSLNPSTKNHTLLLKNGATLRVDGDIVVNSINGGTGPDCDIKDWEVCGDGFDIFGDPPAPPAYISAKSISVAGGWETHDENVVMADGKVWPDYSTLPPTYKSCPSISPNPNLQPLTQPANVCIHVPQIKDPLNNPTFPGSAVPDPTSKHVSVPDAASCPTGTRFPSSNPKATNALVIASDATICPGLYYGGLKITAGTTTMLPGLYFMHGRNGLEISGTASVDGTAGVTVYSSATIKDGGTIHIVPNPDLAKPLDAARLNPVLDKMESSDNPSTTGDEVTYSFELKPVAGGPDLNGTIRFYDGDTEISNPKCQPKVVVNEDKEAKANCKVTYTSADLGTHGISAVFFSDDTCSNDTCYNNFQAVLDPLQVVSGNTGGTAGDIEIDTNGTVQMSASKSGAHKGLLFFQDRDSDGAVLITKMNGKAACSPVETTTVNGVQGPKWALQQPPGAPCGSLGGLEGTIYAPHPDSLVHTTVDGLGNLQVIAGKILIDSQVTTRFAFDGTLFAGNRISLIE